MTYNEVQLTPAQTDLKGPKSFMCYMRISVIAYVNDIQELQGI